MEYKAWFDIDLRLFDGGAAAVGDGAGDITGETQAGPAAAGQGKTTGDEGKEGTPAAGGREGWRTGQGASLDRSEGERWAERRPRDQSETQGKRATDLAGSEPDSLKGLTDAQRKQERRKRYQELIKGEYKDFYTEDTQRIIDKRFKTTKELERQVGKHQPVIDMLMERYGIADGDAEKLRKALDEDHAHWTQAAKEAGMSVEQYKRLRQFQRENKELLDAQRRQRLRGKMDRQFQQWDREWEELRRLYPSFDLGIEARQPRFLALLKAGIPIRHAYEVIHMEDIKAGIARTAAKDAEKQVVAGIRARGARPKENGTSGQSAFTVKEDVSKLTRKDRAEIARRVARGERITF